MWLESQCVAVVMVVGGVVLFRKGVVGSSSMIVILAVRVMGWARVVGREK